MESNYDGVKTDKQVSKWDEPWSGSRVSEISNKFDILKIHHEKPVNYNQPYPTL